jgi:nicotinate-nucleotide adenylyltransferase
MKIAIIGGAFDPIHMGHIQLASLVEPFFNEVWIMPAYDHMHGKKMAPAPHRLRMCRIALLHSPIPLVRTTKISDFEITNKLDDGTFSLMQKLSAAYPDNDFHFVIGQDNADTIHTWRNAEQLQLFTKFFVVPRKGYPLNETPNVWYDQKPHQYLRSSRNLPEISSTYIRQELAAGDPPGHVIDEVHAYIKRCGLYGLEAPET